MEEPLVEIFDGKLRGLISENLDGEKIYKFLGIPYGKPPVGQLRFRAPEPVVQWEGVRDCTKDGPQCVQIEQFGNEAVGSEDCLHVNVFTKELPGTNSYLKPVVVYMFGGKFLFGSNNSNALGPEFLLLEDIVLVTPNSRLGILGFLKLEDPSLDVPGNAGLKDQVLALQWVQKNIKQFGGDPNNVTIAGHSSGAYAVHCHLFSDLSKGFFHRAVIMSGTFLMNYDEDPIFNLTEFTDVLNINAGTEKEILQELQNMPPEAIIDAQGKYAKLYNLRGYIFQPVVERSSRHSFLSENPLELFLNGKFHKVPILATYTDKERLLYLIKDQALNSHKLLSVKAEDIIPPKLKEKIDEFNFKLISLEMDKVYYSNEFSEKIQLLLSDSTFIMPLIATAQTHAVLSDRPVYLMRWSVSDILNNMKAIHNCIDIEGCAHADEIGYIFTMKTLPRPKKGTTAYTTVKRFAEIIKNFSSNGNPATDFASNWQPLQNDKKRILDFGQEVAVKTCPEEERMRFWQRILEFDKRNAYLNHFKTV